jgi:hypothetical protein
MIKDRVLGWLGAGAIFADGVLLFKSINGEKHPLCILLKKESPQIQRILHQALLKQAGIFNLVKPVKKKQQPDPDPSQEPKKDRLRDDWPFLSLPNCPHELKILASNKITAYHNFTDAHARLFDSTRENIFGNAKAAVENYLENRAIYAEFEFYKQQGRVLGRHRVFDQMNRIKSLRKLKIVELIKLKDKLEHSIWRIRSEIKKGNKKHLQVEREQSIIDKEAEIAEIDRILELYG